MVKLKHKATFYGQFSIMQLPSMCFYIEIMLICIFSKLSSANITLSTVWENNYVRPQTQSGISITGVDKMRCIAHCGQYPQLNSVSYDNITKQCVCFTTYEVSSTELQHDEGVTVFSQVGFPGPCDAYLVSGSNPVDNDKMTASSVYRNNYGPYNARLNGTRQWAPAVGRNNSYIQVDFTTARIITSVYTQGRIRIGNKHQYVTKYNLTYSQDCSTFYWITGMDGLAQVFNGNTDGSSIQKNDLETFFICRCVRLHLVEHHGYPILKLDFGGCKAYR